MLGAQAKNVELVAVVANPTYRSTAFTRAFDRQEGLTTVPDWLYLTGLAQPAGRGLAALRGRRGEPARRGHGRAQRPSRGHRPGRAHSSGAELRPRPRHLEYQILVLRAARAVRPAGAEAIVSRGPASGSGLAWLWRARGLAAGCGTQAATVPVTRPPAVTASLSTSLTTAQGTWAIAVMGGSAASHNNFWQLFVRRANTGRWSLATPEGVADNGGLVAAGGNGSLVVGFRPSQELAYSPLATSTDAGLELDARSARCRPGQYARRHRGRAVGAHPRAAAGRHDRGGADGGRRGRRAVEAAGHAQGAGGVGPGSLLRPEGHDRRLVRPRSEPDRGGKLRAAGCGRGLHRRRRDLAVGGTNAARERPGNGDCAGARPDRPPGRQRGAASDIPSRWTACSRPGGTGRAGRYRPR